MQPGSQTGKAQNENSKRLQGVTCHSGERGCIMVRTHSKGHQVDIIRGRCGHLPPAVTSSKLWGTGREITESEPQVLSEWLPCAADVLVCRYPGARRRTRTYTAHRQSVFQQSPSCGAPRLCDLSIQLRRQYQERGEQEPDYSNPLIRSISAWARA